MKFTEHTIRVGFTYIHYASCGKGEPVILIHGLTNNWEGHIPLASELGKYYQVFIPDMPGYGDSGTLGYYNVQIMSLYLKKFMRALGLHSAVIAGLSMGGFIVGHFVRVNPRYVKKAIILGPVLHDVQPKADVMKYIMKIADILPVGRRLLKRLVDTKAHAYLTAKYLNMYSFNKKLIDTYGLRGKHKMTKDAYVEMGLSVAGYDLGKTLSHVHVPTLLLYGKEDRMSKSSYAIEHVMPRNPLLSIAVIPEAGHVVSFEKPKETTEIIRSFLKT